MMRLFLCGFSGSGKTTLGEKLSASDSFGVFDLDEEIFNRMGSGHDHLGDYIEEIGLSEFRKDEVDMVKVLHQNFKDNYLVILGGGALESKALLDHIENVEGVLIHLEIDFEECWNRIVSSKDRPLVKKGKKFMNELFLKRQSQYGLANKKITQDQVLKINSIVDLEDLITLSL